MSNERYLIISYFALAAVGLGWGVLVYYILRRPFEGVADAIVGKTRSTVLQRALVLSMTGASVLGFLGVSYNQQGCTKYEHVFTNASAWWTGILSSSRTQPNGFNGRCSDGEFWWLWGWRAVRRKKNLAPAKT